MTANLLPQMRTYSQDRRQCFNYLTKLSLICALIAVRKAFRSNRGRYETCATYAEYVFCIGFAGERDAQCKGRYLSNLQSRLVGCARGRRRRERYRSNDSDLTTLINPTTIANSLGNSGAFDIVGDITSLSVTVTGAPGGGNGTWTKADLCACSTQFGAFTDAFTIWDTNGQTVNMDGDVLAQLMADGGDFNLWFKGDGPQGVGRLILDPDGGGVGGMLMTEFAPVVTPPVVTPEPSTISLMLTGVALLGVMAARKRLSLGHSCSIR